MTKPASTSTQDPEPASPLGVLAPLPQTLTTFVGRDELLARLDELLRSGNARLVTLTGPGGVGKTRLAINLANRLHGVFSRGIGYVSLADTLDPGLVLPAIAARLGVREGNRASLLDRVCDAFAQGTSLLIIDNYEHVVASAPTLIDLVSRSPGLTLLVTSRTPLHVSGERVVPIPPLGVPEQGAVAEVVDSDSVKLFIERAEAIRPGITLSEAASPAIGEICQRLDGMPLAIELAAARTAALPLPALLTRLTNRLPILVSGPRDQPARLQTMRNAIAWSYDLLTPEDRATFRALSAFVGGFTLDAAEAVAGAPGGSALEAIESLVDQSLVRAVPEMIEEPRYAMLETIREFGLEQLAGSGEEAAVRRRHAGYVLRLVEEIDPLIDTADHSALARIDLDRPNVLAALTWLNRHHHAAEALRLGSAMWRYWRIRGFLTEGRDQLAQALALPVDVPAAVRAEALWKLGYLEFYLGEDVAARQHLEAASALFEEAGDVRGLATAVDALGAVLRFAREPALAAEQQRRALDLRRQLGDRFGESMPLASLGMLALDRGATEDARELLQQAFDITVEHGSRREIAHRLLNLAQLELAGGNQDLARAHASDALATFTGIGDLVASTTAHDLLGRIELSTGDRVRAAHHSLESLHLRLQLGLHRDLTDIVERLAIVILPEDAGFAARLMGAADGSRETSGHRRLAADDLAWQEAMADASATLGPAAYERARQRGRTLDIATAARLAEAHLASHSPVREAVPAPQPVPAVTAPPSLLTTRELEVLRLVAAGHTNRVIAATLFISPATVKRHVTNILTKLELPTRAAAISYALRNGLVSD